MTPGAFTPSSSGILAPQTGSFVPTASGSYPGTTPGTPVVVKRGGTVGLIIGVVGLAVALGAVLFVLYGPHRKTTVVNLQSPATTESVAKSAASREAPKPEPKDDDIAAVPVDSLGASRPDRRAPSVPVAPRPKGKGTQTGTEPPQPSPPSTGAAPPRKNPYE
jgi:hypothetical protein